MYTTRSLSEYLKNPSELTQPPHEGPNSGILLVLPLPQNLKLTARFVLRDDDMRYPVMFIPVLDQPLSSNRYYAINGRGFNSREAYVSGKKEEEERVSCCFGLSYVPEPRPKQLDPHDIYQQFEIHQKKPSSHCYYATSVAPDGVSTWLLRKDNWVIEYSRSKEFELRDDAKGLNKELRSELPSLGTSVVVGKWYVPFVFVKERKVKDQHKRSMYYIMTLEQRWEEVFSCENDKGENRDVVVHVEVENEIVKLEGQKIVRGVDANRFVWFGVGDKKIGLGSVVVERMKWEEERFGWTSKGDRTMSVKMSEKSEDGSFWKSYHCYVLKERFILKRMNQSLVLTYEFTHVNKLKSKWD